MFADRIEGKWIDAFCEVFERCAVKRGDTAAILSETQSRALNVQLAELALRGCRVVLEDLDQGRHLSRVFVRHPLGLETLKLDSSGPRDVTILDTAPEAQRERRSSICAARTGCWCQ